MRKVTRPSLASVLRTFRPNAHKFAQFRSDVRRWIDIGGSGFSEQDYTLSGFLLTRSLFVHVPKAAGSSVAQSLYGNRAAGHISIADYQSFIRISALESMFTFTFVRNPWDRVFSAYNFLKRGGWPVWDASYAEQYLSGCHSFEQFVHEVLPLDAARQKIHFRPMASFLKQQDGTWYPFKFVGRFERFAEDFSTVRQKVNPTAKITHQNPTDARGKRDYREAYSYEMIELVGRIYAEDVAGLGYSFDGFEDYYPSIP